MSEGARRGPYQRTRFETNYARTPVAAATFHTFGSTSGTYVDTTSPRTGGYRGFARLVTDVVTPGFASLRDAGHVLNNPFVVLRYDMDWGGAGPIVKWAKGTNPWPAGVTETATHTTSQLNQNVKFWFPPPLDELGRPEIEAVLYTGVESLRRQAKTSALGNVDQSIAQGLVGIVELKKTLASLANPLSSIQRYVSRWKLRPVKNGRKLFIREGEGLIPSVANQYLELYYGLLPFVHDIESYLQAYVQSASDHPRQTARGYARDTYETTGFYNGNRSATNSSQYDAKFSRLEEIVARSGILYEPSPMTLKKAMGLRWGDVLPAAYEIMPWSFFMDYFSNLGSLIEALTPRQGVNYLAAWDTIVTKITTRSEVLTTWITGDFVHSRVGNEWATRVMEARYRSPTGIYANIGLVAHTGVWESKAKVAAVLSLLLQQLGPRVVPPAIWRA